MDQYHILRDDWEFVQAVSHFKKMRASPLNAAGGDIPAAVKSAFTREFNKTHHTESFVKGALQHMAGVDTQADDAEAEAENADDGKGLLKGGAGATKKPAAKRAAAKKAAAKKESAPKPKAKRAPPKAKKAAAKRRRKAKESDSEDEFTGDSSDSSDSSDE
ncbi:replication factor C, subunit 1 [Trypanosoma conorhini]|uniref:Replication factor C, subunit 1 n=1 Tax=Trypanosoma conorhini TaxID=83891 RepID=A0A3R7KWE2_9TRYP|nr:replication factor C, subunit 1 [Trypanosoma conorhini]RNF11011.1 replication factor C, subunit 1 [Trypanosoma conorhini]